MKRDLLIGIAMGVLLTLGLLAVALWLASRWIKNRISSGLEPARARSLKGWDYRMRLRAMDDQIVEASAFRDRTLFLNFWATWCTPCVAELPSIERWVSRLLTALQCLSPKWHRQCSRRSQSLDASSESRCRSCRSGARIPCALRNAPCG